MKTFLRLTAIPVLSLVVIGALAQQAAPSATSSTSGTPSALQKTVEAYLRNAYAFGPDVQVSVGLPKETPIAGLLVTEIQVKIGDTQEKVKFYVSKDGKYLLRGDLSDLSQDPLAENRAKIQLQDAPILGDPKASVTLVEYSDFQCPVCRNLHDVLRGMLPNYPQVRLVFKDFPLEQVHPWARTAALAGRCAYAQDPKAFWKLYDQIYDNQELISAENAWAKMLDYASRVGLNPDNFKACISGPEAAAAIKASLDNGQLLDVNSTPTIFVNGRRIVGPDPHLIEQYIKYELAQQESVKPNEKK